MAFIGAFFVTILMGIFGIFIWIAVALIICAILFIFILCLIIAIINLIKCIKHHWPKRNIIPLAITGSIVTLFVVAFMVICIQSAFAGNPTNGTGASSSAVTALRFLLKL